MKEEKIMGKMIIAVFYGAALFLSINLAAYGADGKALYQRNCAVCHGLHGEGKPPLARGFKVDPALLILRRISRTDEEILFVMKGGRNRMPAFGERLTAEEYQAILQHIRSLVP